MRATLVDTELAEVDIEPAYGSLLRHIGFYCGVTGEPLLFEREQEPHRLIVYLPHGPRGFAPAVEATAIIGYENAMHWSGPVDFGCPASRVLLEPAN